jgi:hypothetical protein
MKTTACAGPLILALTLSLCACDDKKTDHDRGSATESDGGAEPGADAGQDAGAAPADAQAQDASSADASSASETDYTNAANWLCRPGHNEACSASLDTTIVKADGSTEREAFTPDAQPKVDCFYVYPTVSLDTTPNSDLVPGMEEKNVVMAQAARFASQCRVFAPMYRQVTLTALRASLAGMPNMADQTLGYKDVLAAFRSYLKNDNGGRGFVLLSHSQGSRVLTQLIKDELDKEPRDARFIGALILGSNVLVPKDKLVGGTFQHVPLCSSSAELGCVVTYASFRSSAPPPDNSLFAVSTDPNLVAGCTNPAALGGGSGALRSYLGAMGAGASGLPMPAWATGKTIDTPWVSVPGMLSAECKFAKTGSYLAITVTGDPADPRADDIVGDVVTNGMVQANWGLHLIDAHVAMGNLLDIVRDKIAAHAKR